MDDEPFPHDEAAKAAGESAMQIIDALGDPEVQAAISAYSISIELMVKAFVARGIPVATIAGWLSATVVGRCMELQ